MLMSIPWSLHLRKIRPDIALDLQGLLRSALMARLSRAGRAIGISDAREGATRLYHEVIPVIRGEHAVLRYLRVLGGLGLPKIERPVFPLPPGVPLNGPFRNQPFVVLHPFARGEGKSLEPDHVVRPGPVQQCPHRCCKEAAAGLLAHHQDAKRAAVQPLALPRSAQVEPIVIIADEQQRRVHARLLLVHSERQPLVAETGEGPRRRDEHREPLAPA